MNSPMPIARLWESAPRFFFFTGKGGVGKTSLSCAVAIALADAGKRVLLVSTDPASNLDEVLGVALGREPRPIPEVPGLQALNINPEAAARVYREKIIGPLRGQLPAAALSSIEERLSGACTTEIAAFDEFSRLLGNASATAAFDHVIFDTAPTGHTLRLLMLPKAWAGFLAQNTTGASCLGPLAGLDQQRAVYEAAVAVFADGSRTTIVLVSRAQAAALREARRTRDELAKLGAVEQRLVLNGVFRAESALDPVAAALEANGERALREFDGFLDSLPVYEVALRPENLLGIDALRALVLPPRRDWKADAVLGSVETGLEGIAAVDCGELLELLAAPGHGVIMTMGKGGVGKTTVAAAVAVHLARRGFAVHLSTTDPAAHVAAALRDQVPGLVVSRIDPQAETAAYVAEVLAAQGPGLDPESLSLLEEDLRSPCTEEIAVFRAFARTVALGSESFVVLDTAPTGHTVLLLDATLSYHRELGRQARHSLPGEVCELLPRLRDPQFTRVLIVTLPEATPVHEAAALQEDLRRAGIHPFAWIINQSFAMTGSTDPLLIRRGANELRYLREVAGSLAARTAVLPWSPEEPVGCDALAALLRAHCQTYGIPEPAQAQVPSLHAP
jgi:arsenite/tail-anchored protein-transporting ATPase